MSVLELAEAKTHLNLSGTEINGELQAFIGAAEAAISRKVGQLEITTHSERITGRRTALEVTHLPLVEVVSITPDLGSELDVSTIEIDAAGVITSAAGYGRFNSAAYRVVYKAGWLDPDDVNAELQGDLLLAVKELVRHLWATQRGGGVARPGVRPSEAVSSTVPGAGYALPIRVEQLLAPYVPLGSA